VTIDRLGHLGDGLATTPQGTVFALGALPGEVVEGELQGDVLSAVRIVLPSADRVKPPCPHARTCGGCQLQHATDAFVETWKKSVVASALAAHGLSAPIIGVATSPPQSRRRAVLSARRTKSGVLIGFHARGSEALVAIPNCKLLHADLLSAIPGLEELVLIGGSRSAELSLAVTQSEAGVDVCVSGGKVLDSEMRMALARVVERHRFARLTWSEEVVALRDSPNQRFGRASVNPPPGAFLQATHEGEAALLAAVKAALGPNQQRIADLFAGSGTFTFPLAESVEVHGVEGDAAMVRALDKAARNTQGLRRISLENRDLFRRPLEPDELARFSAVVIDPPRAGAEAQTARLATSGVPVIAMVSCNPQTFARDAALLVASGYALDWVQVVDQFRWSTHVELAARFFRQK